MTLKPVFGDPASIALRDQPPARSAWQREARPVIAAVIEANRGKSMLRIRKAIREAYPWGPRENQPYAMWLKEARLQLGAYLDSLGGQMARPEARR